MADGVDAAVRAMQATGFKPARDLPCCQARREQLAPRHNSELTGGEPGDDEVRVLDLRTDL